MPASRGTSVSSVWGSGKIGPIDPVEAPDDLARQLEMGGLVLADGHEVRLVDDDVGRLEDGIAQKSVRVEVPVLDLLLHLLERRDAFEPGQGRDHGQDEMEFGVLLDVGLEEHHAFLRVEPDGEPVQGDLERVGLDDLGVHVLRAQGVPADDRVEAPVDVLKFQPVAQGADEVAEMLRSRRPDSAEDDLPFRVRSSE